MRIRKKFIRKPYTNKIERIFIIFPMRCHICKKKIFFKHMWLWYYWTDEYCTHCKSGDKVPNYVCTACSATKESTEEIQSQFIRIENELIQKRMREYIRMVFSQRREDKKKRGGRPHY